MKNNKAAAPDDIINEYIKMTGTKIFNYLEKIIKQ